MITDPLRGLSVLIRAALRRSATPTSDTKRSTSSVKPKIVGAAQRTRDGPRHFALRGQRNNCGSENKSNMLLVGEIGPLWDH